MIGNLDGGKLVGIHGVARDVSERERLERELQDSEARLEQMLQTSPDVIWRADAEGRFTFLTERATELFGWNDGGDGRPALQLPGARRVDARRGH